MQKLQYFHIVCMIKKYLFAMLYINLSLIRLFSTNVSLTSCNINNSLKVEICDKFNKLSINFEKNKKLELNTLKFEKNNIFIKKENTQLNEQIIIDNSLRYIICFDYELFKITSTIPSFTNEKIDIKSIELNFKNLIIQSTYYYNNTNINNKFYYDFSNLLYTKNGNLFYLEYEFKNILTYQEFAITNYGIFYSSIYALKLNYFTFYFNLKNINEKYSYKVVFNYGNFEYDTIDKIYDISIYGGQGIKRNRQVNSKIKLNRDFKSIKVSLYLNLSTEIDYDVFLRRTINNNYKLRTTLKTNKNIMELCLNYNDNFDFYLIYNNVKINYSNKIIYLQFNFENKNNKSNYNIEINSDKKIEIKYQRYL